MISRGTALVLAAIAGVSAFVVTIGIVEVISLVRR